MNTSWFAVRIDTGRIDTLREPLPLDLSAKGDLPELNDGWEWRQFDLVPHVEDASEPREHIEDTGGTITPPAGREAPMGSQEAP